MPQASVHRRAASQHALRSELHHGPQGALLVSRCQVRARLGTDCENDDARGAQVLGETEVKAQIKLRIMTAAGSPVVIVRSFQVPLV